MHGERGVDPTEPPSDAPYPFPAISHEPRIAQLSADLSAAGLHPFPLPNGILLDEAAPWRSACIRCATCDGYACPTNGKADAAVIAVDPALRYPNVTLLTGALVTRLETDASGRSVTGVVVERDGETERYSADVVVVAGGAINSAALLLRSASDQHPDGLGNGSGQVGRNLMLHNNSSLIAFSQEPNPTKFQKTLGINDFYHADPDSDFPFPLGAMQMLGKSDATLIAFDVKDHPDPAEVARHALDFWLTTEDLPLPDNRVTVDADGAISLRYTPTNLAAHARLREKFESLLSAMQCRDEVYENLSYVGGRLGIAGVAHQNGTVRFGTDPATSALDLDCKLHELDNVYVADSSFFVSSTAVNPTLTIIANALRVAETVAGRLGASTLAEPVVRPRVPEQGSPARAPGEPSRACRHDDRHASAGAGRRLHAVRRRRSSHVTGHDPGAGARCSTSRRTKARSTPRTRTRSTSPRCRGSAGRRGSRCRWSTSGGWIWTACGSPSKPTG